MRRSLLVAVALAAAAVPWSQLVAGDPGVRPEPAQRDMILLHEFAGGGSDGAYPAYGSLTLSGSTLYGVASGGGGSNDGVVFSIGANGSGLTLLHEFAGATDGATPVGSLTLSGSTLYGVTNIGGPADVGVVFAVGADGSGFTLLHGFAGGDTDAGWPLAGLTLSGSTLYGTASGSTKSNSGVVFAVGTNGSGFTLLHTFAGGGDDGALPYGSLTLSGSTLYGMTDNGGPFDDGVVFAIGTNGTGFTLLHEFAGGVGDGRFPREGLTLSGSTLYGMTYNGGPSDHGVVFALGTDGSGFTLLHEFAGGSADGANPAGDVTLSGSTLYGMTERGGGSDMGVAFSVGTGGSAFTLLHGFAGGGDDGAYPYGGLTLSGAALYGMTMMGGDLGLGVIFRLRPGLIFADAVIPAAAANSGAHGTYWGTDVWLTNTSENEGTVRIRAGNQGQPASESAVASWTLPPGEVVTIQDVLSSFPGFSAPGALFLTYEGVDPADVAGASRTYTNAPSGAPGTLGQGMPLLQISQLYGSGTPMYAPIAGREGFRTNLGIVNAGSTEATLLVEVVGEGGAPIGDTTVTLPPESWRQQEVFGMVGVPPTAFAYVRIVGQSGSSLWAYTSEVDNSTGDPTTMGAKTAYAGTQQLFVPAAAHLDGEAGTTWVTDLDYVNLSSSSSSANLVFLEEGVDNYNNPGPAQAFDLTSGQHRFFADVLVELFGITGKKGSLWSEPLDTHLIWSRTFNQGPSGTFGQELPAIIGDTDVITGDLEGVLVGLSENDEYRTNLGLLNTGVTTATFEVKLYDDAGTTLDTITRDVPPMSLAQLNRVYGTHAVTNGRIDVKVTSGQGFAYSSMVDESTGDPTTQYATISPPPPAE